MNEKLAALVGALGLIVGGAIALGVPYIVLMEATPQQLGSVTVILLSALGVVGGVGLAITSIVFSLINIFRRGERGE
jgi:hypothetical protein